MARLVPLLVFGLFGLTLVGCPEEPDPDPLPVCLATSCPEGETCVINPQGELVCFIAEDPLGPMACTDDDDCPEDQRCIDPVDGGARRCVYVGRDGGD